MGGGGHGTLPTLDYALYILSMKKKGVQELQQ